MRAHRMVAVVALLLGSAAILWHEQSLWAEVGPDRLASVRVGEPVAVAPGPSTKKCCKKGLLLNCVTSCITNPNCPIGTVLTATCEAATCQDVNDENSACSTPSRSVVGSFGSCTLTGNTVACTDPANTSKCESRATISNVTYTTCNANQTNCTTQPTDVCP